MIVRLKGHAGAFTIGTMVTRLSLFAAIVLGALCLPCSAQLLGDTIQPDLGYDLLELSRLAEQGDSRAAFFVGRRFATGDGVARDYGEAVRWFKRASDDDLAEAQYWLGIMHAQGHGVPRSNERAAAWFKRAAEQGLADAQHAYGTLLLRDAKNDRRRAQAAEWLRKAARQGLAKAQYNLGVMYEFGRGVKLNLASAKDWYKRASAQGFDAAAARLKSLTERVTAVEQGRKAPAPTQARPRESEREAVRIDPDEALDGLADNRFTLQLVSYRTFDRAVSAVRRFKLDPDARIYTLQSRGRLWYVVIYGEFATESAATKAVESLPVALRKAQPRVRGIGAIRRQLAAQQNAG